VFVDAPEPLQRLETEERDAADHEGRDEVVARRRAETEDARVEGRRGARCITSSSSGSASKTSKIQWHGIRP
jgi:hypothetical protein